ncbi:SRPBCC family protein [Mycolicibacterium sp.]|uniref:SRPBCC family protein n=1 Tax=Mycolicibacterium sp. TaxID=2320850 RepID=UPI003560A1E4
MKIANEFTVSAPIARAWEVLTDLEEVIPLMPGATLGGREGEDVLGKVKVKVGPVTSEFSGRVRFVEQDAAQYRAVIDGKGKEARGTGNATATVTAQLHEDGECTRVTVDTDLKVVGKLAQFGSGMLQQVSEKLLGQFVDSLEAKLAADGQTAEPQTAEPQTAEPTAAPVAAAPAQPAEAAPIDLLELAGGQTLKRYGPMVAALFAAAAAVFALGRVLLGRRVERDRR